MFAFKAFCIFLFTVSHMLVFVFLSLSEFRVIYFYYDFSLAYGVNKNLFLNLWDFLTIFFVTDFGHNYLYSKNMLCDFSALQSRIQSNFMNKIFRHFSSEFVFCDHWVWWSMCVHFVKFLVLINYFYVLLFLFFFYFYFFTDLFFTFSLLFCQLLSEVSCCVQFSITFSFSLWFLLCVSWSYAVKYI